MTYIAAFYFISCHKIYTIMFVPLWWLLTYTIVISSVKGHLIALQRALLIEVSYYNKFHDILRYHFIPLINGLKPCSNIFTPNHIILTKDILRWCINQKTLKCRIMTEDGAITYFSRIIAIFRIELMDVHFSIQNQWRMK